MQTQDLVVQIGPTVTILENGFSGVPCIAAVIAIANRIKITAAAVKKTCDLLVEGDFSDKVLELGCSDDSLELNNCFNEQRYLMII